MYYFPTLVVIVIYCYHCYHVYCIITIIIATVFTIVVIYCCYQCHCRWVFQEPKILCLLSLLFLFSLFFVAVAVATVGTTPEHPGPTLLSSLKGFCSVAQGQETFRCLKPV